MSSETSASTSSTLSFSVFTRTIDQYEPLSEEYLDFVSKARKELDVLAREFDHHPSFDNIDLTDYSLSNRSYQSPYSCTSSSSSASPQLFSLEEMPHHLFLRVAVFCHMPRLDLISAFYRELMHLRVMVHENLLRVAGRRTTWTPDLHLISMQQQESGDLAKSLFKIEEALGETGNPEITLSFNAISNLKTSKILETTQHFVESVSRYRGSFCFFLSVIHYDVLHFLDFIRLRSKTHSQQVKYTLELPEIFFDRLNEGKRKVKPKDKNNDENPQSLWTFFRPTSQIPELGNHSSLSYETYSRYEKSTSSNSKHTMGVKALWDYILYFHRIYPHFQIVASVKNQSESQQIIYLANSFVSIPAPSISFRTFPSLTGLSCSLLLPGILTSSGAKLPSSTLFIESLLRSLLVVHRAMWEVLSRCRPPSQRFLTSIFVDIQGFGNMLELCGVSYDSLNGAQTGEEILHIIKIESQRLRMIHLSLRQRQFSETVLGVSPSFMPVTRAGKPLDSKRMKWLLHCAKARSCYVVSEYMVLPSFLTGSFQACAIRGGLNAAILNVSQSSVVEERKDGKKRRRADVAELSLVCSSSSPLPALLFTPESPISPVGSLSSLPSSPTCDFTEEKEP